MNKPNKLIPCHLCGTIHNDGVLCPEEAINKKLFALSRSTGKSVFYNALSKAIIREYTRRKEYARSKGW